MPQGDDAWIAARLGKCTASRIHDATARLKAGAWGASRENYKMELVIERLYGEPFPHFVTAAMQAGKELEPHARAAYQSERLIEVTLAEFVPHPTIQMCGASPDGYVGRDGLIECKCPEPAAHMMTLRNIIDERYIKQMQFQMAVTGRVWCDFVSYNPMFLDKETGDDERLTIQRVHRDPKRIAALEQDVRDFLDEVAATVEYIRARRLQRAA
jgi:hypothetical protein